MHLAYCLISESKDDEDEDDEDEDDEDAVKLVEEEYEDIQATNIIPRSKRRAALSSGLARASSKPKASKKAEDEDEEAEF